MKHKIYWRQLRRMLTQNLGRVLAIMGIVALGAGFLAGLSATSPVMKENADRYYRETSYMDFTLLSTLGITEDDVEAFANADGIDKVEAGYRLDLVSKVEGRDNEAIFRFQSVPEEINTLVILEGRMPENASECLILSAKDATEMLKVGDRILPMEEGLKEEALTIVGRARSPEYISIVWGTTSKGNGSLDRIFFTTKDAFDLEYYTVMYAKAGMPGAGASGAQPAGTGATAAAAKAGAISTFSDEYWTIIDAEREILEPLADERGEIRYNGLMSEAQDKIDEAWDEYNTQKADAEKEIEDARQELLDAEAEIADAKETIADSEKQLEEAKDLLYDGWLAYRTGSRELTEQEEAAAEQIAASRSELDTQEEGVRMMEMYGMISPEEAALYYGQIAMGREIIDAKEAEALAAFEAARAELKRAYQTLIRNQNDYDEGVEELEQAKIDLEEAEKKVEDGWAELHDAEAELEDKLAEAREEIEDAESKLEDIPEATWYVLDREQNESYVSYKGDCERMRTIASVFPWIFFVVAALVSLTTMTRMIEEERTLIGTYKALGFSKGRILNKYLVYAGSACTVGALLGMTAGFQIFPRVICYAYNTMYLMPEPEVHFYVRYALIAGGAALVCTLGATVWACLNSLRSRPAVLMLPAAPKAGKKIFLEHIPFLWRRVSFIWKVTLRNLFRYKKRFWMTTIGIAGCMALMVTGYGIKDSVMDIINNQFYKVYNYEGHLGVADEDDVRALLEKDKANAGAGSQENAEGAEGAEGTANANDALFTDTLFVYNKMVDAKANHHTLSCYLYVPEDAERLNDFINIRERVSGKDVDFHGDEVVLTEKAAMILGLSVGDMMELPCEDGTYAEVRVDGICENYLRNYIFVPRSVYEGVLGHEETEFTEVLFKTEKTSEEIRDRLSGEEAISVISFMDDMIGPVRHMLSSLNVIIYVLIVSAALLAFIVLYNLTNINIIERMRELATIKVLGFQRMEICAYVFRETMLLTLIGTLLGCGMGVIMHRFVITTVEVDYVMFGRNIEGIHFLLSAALTVLFSLMVDFAMYFRLKKINMVESLKSVD